MRPRLTAQDLARLYDECPTEQMRAVLWEVAYLQSRIKRASIIRNDLGDECPPRVNKIHWDCFIAEIDSEPSLRDEMTPRQRRRAEAYVARARAEEEQTVANSGGKSGSTQSDNAKKPAR
jgi:hypothetical protein